MTYIFPETDIPIKKYHFGDKIINGQISNFPIFFSYDYIDIKQTDFSFSQKCLNNFDIIKYFKKVKDISNKTLNELIDDSDFKEHFHIYNNPRGKLLSLIKIISGKKHIKDEELPSIGQFALYTHPKGSSRSKGIKSPRIFFIVGHSSILYIILYDPYHEIKE